MVLSTVYRAILPDTDIDCERYEETQHGVEVFNANDEMIAFVPYTSLVAIINDEVETSEERSIM